MTTSASKLSWSPRTLRIAVVAAGFLAALWIGYQLRSVLNPFLLSALFAYMLNPLVEWLERKGFRRMRAILLIYAVCSWLPEECARHRSWVLETYPDYLPAPVWAAGMGVESGPTSFFRPNPLTWDGEGFQGFALTRE